MNANNLFTFNVFVMEILIIYQSGVGKNHKVVLIWTYLILLNFPLNYVMQTKIVWLKVLDYVCN